MTPLLLLLSLLLSVTLASPAAAAANRAKSKGLLMVNLHLGSWVVFVWLAQLQGQRQEAPCEHIDTTACNRRTYIERPS
jgi:predicted LPLAT superfamily acyltransferase